MNWDLYYSEICKAKEEYDRTLQPLIEIVLNAHKHAWERYVHRIKDAEILLKEEMS